MVNTISTIGLDLLFVYAGFSLLVIGTLLTTVRSKVKRKVVLSEVFIHLIFWYSFRIVAFAYAMEAFLLEYRSKIQLQEAKRVEESTLQLVKEVKEPTLLEELSKSSKNR